MRLRRKGWDEAKAFSYNKRLQPQTMSVASATDSVNGNWTYGYDQFNRLAASNKNSGAQTFSYVYDRKGNRLQQNVTQGSGPAPQYTFDNINRIAGSR